MDVPKNPHWRDEVSEIQQTGTDYERRQFEDEIELMDYLRVIWKWKYLIVAGTLICAVAGGVISFSMPKVYSIDMLIRPGILTITQEGKNVYIDSAEYMKATIEAGIFPAVPITLSVVAIGEG